MPLFHLTDEAINPVPTETFSNLKVLERTHLQRLLRQSLEIVAPECMLIAEEFGDWADARRRIDLLALDRSGNLVVIELKRTEDGGHADLQAIRYAAMISTMTFDQAVEAHARYLKQIGVEADARQQILNFLDWQEPRPAEFCVDVRMILVASDFSKEMTTAALWLRGYDVDIACIRLRPYLFEGQTLLNVETLIPLPETAEYQVRVRERDEARREANQDTERYQKYDIVANGAAERQLSKRHAIHRVIRALAAAGVTPEQMSGAVPSRGAYLFVSAPGRLRSDAFIDAARAECEGTGRAFDPARYFLKDGELIYASGRTWAVLNQWGPNTELVLSQLVNAFPDASVRWERSAPGS